MEEEISLKDYKALSNYLIKIVKSYKNFNGLLTGFSLSSFIFLFSASFGNISEDNFNKLMEVIAWIILSFIFFLTNTLIYYVIESSCYSIEFNDEYNYIEKYNKLNKRYTFVAISHIIFILGLFFLGFTIILIIQYFAEKSLEIIFRIVLVLSFSSLIVLLIFGSVYWFWKLISFIKKRRKH